MKTILFVLIALLAFPLTTLAQDTKEKKITNPIIENIFNRKSVRSYQDRPVSLDTLQILIRAAMAAPSARNIQPWEFFIIRDRERMNILAEALPYGKMLSHAPSAIIILGNTSISTLWMYDCSVAAQNLLLAAESLGLGAVWTAAYPYEDRMKIIMKTLGIPSPYLPLCVIPIGYPKGETKPKDKWKPERLHIDKW